MSSTFAEPVVIRAANGCTATLYCADCLDVLPTLEENSVDAVVTDPPYGINHLTSHSASWAGKSIEGDDSTKARDYVWNLYTEKPRAMFGISWKKPPPPNVRMALIWDKGGILGAGDLSIPWKPCWEEIYIGGYGWKGPRNSAVLRGPCMLSWESGPAHDGNGRKHPHEKPVWLLCALIEKLPEVRTILDPFMGSGTTGVAALKLGCNFVGIEIDAHYYAIAERRIRAAAQQASLLLTREILP